MSTPKPVPDPLDSPLGRVLRILECFRDSDATLNATQISGRTGLATSTAQRLARNMASLGYLDEVAKGSYTVGARMWEIGAKSTPPPRLRAEMLPYLRQLNWELKCHTHLGVLRGQEVLYLEMLPAIGAGAVNITRVASRLPANSCSAGLALYAFSSHEAQEAFISAPPPPLTEHTLTDPDQLRHALADVRLLRYAVVRGGVHPEAAGVAAPVFGKGWGPVAAIAVIVKNDKHEILNAIPHVVRAARDAGRALDSNWTSVEGAR